MNSETYFTLIAGTITFSGFVLFAFSVIFFAKRKFRRRQEFLKAQVEAREETFLQIGRELHDNIGQLLSTAKILISITERTLSTPPDTLRAASDTLGKAIQDMRALTKALNREWLQKFNIIENLRVEIDRINSAGIIFATLEFDGPVLPMKAEEQILLFRIIQEGLQNGIRHSEADRITINILLDLENIQVSIRDNGNGLLPESGERKGLGMMNMIHRTNLLRGKIRWHSPDGQGLRIDIIVPIDKSQKRAR